MSRKWLCAVACAALLPGASRAQHARSAGEESAVALAILLSAAGDAHVRDWMLEHHTPVLDRIADVVDPLGQAGHLVPALVVSVVAPRLVGNRALSNSALRVALGYAAADGVESILKPVIGRHRPDDRGGAWRFSPFRNDAEWHSTPSAHTVHVFSIATGLALESRSPWVAVPAYGVATLVGLNRVYRTQHWLSDVTASTALAIVTASATDRALRRRGLPRVLPPVGGKTIEFGWEF